MDLSVLDQRPVVVAVAGPNGAGKSTFHGAHLAQGSPSPALMFASESGGGSEATMRTDVFDTMKGLTFTFRLAVDVTTLQAGSADRVSFQVVDVNGTSPPLAK